MPWNLKMTYFIFIKTFLILNSAYILKYKKKYLQRKSGEALIS